MVEEKTRIGEPESLEELREALLSLERRRVRAEERQHESEVMLAAVQAILDDDAESGLRPLFQAARQVIDFSQAILLRERADDGALECVDASEPKWLGSAWRPDRLFRRVLDGETVAALRVRQLKEWAAQPSELLEGVGSALHGPIHEGGERGLIILTHPEARAFGREHVRRLERVSVLAAQTLARAAARRLREENVALAAARRAAEEVSEAKSSFLATMSHELRTPMMGILGMLDLLDASGLDSTQRRRAEVLRRSAETLRVLLDQVLDYSKMDAGALTLESVDFDVEKDVLQTVEIYRGSAESANVDLRVEPFEPPELRWAKGDPVRLRQVVQNLASNAIKFAQGGRVTVRGRAVKAGDEGSTFLLEVEDDGPGIPEEQRCHLFEPFVQADGTITRRYGGTGLGLAICDGIAQAMAGRLSVESVVGQGSTFSLEVDLPRGVEPEVTTNPSPRLAPSARRFRLLVVDDHPINRLVLDEGLSVMGHEVSVVDDGASALARLESETFDGVLTDLHMPEMDGAALVQAIRLLPPPASEIPVFVLSADVDPAVPGRFEGLGVSGVLSKPVDFEALAVELAKI